MSVSFFFRSFVRFSFQHAKDDRRRRKQKAKKKLKAIMNVQKGREIVIERVVTLRKFNFAFLMNHVSVDITKNRLLRMS